MRSFHFADLPDGRPVSGWRFGHPGRIEVEVLDLGARVLRILVPDRTGTTANVALAPAFPADLLGPARYFGATAGRYANRIAGGELPLDGTVHRLKSGEQPHTLHGGPDGFDQRLWQAAVLRRSDSTGIAFTLHSPHGDQGFPGSLTARVTYAVRDDGSLTIDYDATTDAPTVVNLTNHTYFNLGGDTGGTVLDHELGVAAAGFTPVDADLIPLGGPPAPVDGTPFDLRRPYRIGDRLGDTHPQLALAHGGYDHNWVLGDAPASRLRPAATLRHPATGRTLECLTTEPGLQIHTGSLFDHSVMGTGGRTYPPFAGVALETQHFPDSPHRPDYPTTVLRPGERFRSTTVYRFGTDAH